MRVYSFLERSTSSHCVLQNAPQIRLNNNEACKMQLVLWRLFEVQGDPSSYCSYLDTIRVAELSLSALISIHLEKKTKHWSCALRAAYQ